ncbi:hypothetical protein T492DRAFT_894814, partial [Pavlovales sp. CCMP2436]
VRPVEERWRFRIRSAGIDLPVLLVGAMREPTVSLRNEEHIPFAFAFDPKSYSSAATGDGQVVVTFSPSAEKDFNYNLMCLVKKKPTPLTLN